MNDQPGVIEVPQNNHVAAAETTAAAAAEANDAMNYDVSNLLRTITSPGVMDPTAVRSVWSALRAEIVRVARPGFCCPASVNDRNIIPLIAFFIVHTASSRQPGHVILDVGDFKFEVGMLIKACGARLRQFLRAYHHVAFGIMTAESNGDLRSLQASHYGLHMELSAYAFDFVDLRRTTLDHKDQLTVSNAIERKLRNSRVPEGEVLESQSRQSETSNSMASFMNAPPTRGGFGPATN